MVSAKQVFSSSGHSSAVYCLCQGTKSGTIISGSGDKFIAQWNLKDGTQEKFSAKLPSPVFSLLNLTERHQLWVGTGSGNIHVLDTKANREIHVFSFHTAQVFCIEKSPANGLIYSCAGDGTVAVFDAGLLSNVSFEKVSQQKLRSINFLKDNILIAEGAGNSLLLEAASFNVVTTFKSDSFATNCHLITEQGSRLVSGGRDAHLRIWDISDNYKLLKKIPAHNFAIYRLLSLKTDTLFATASRDKTIKLWDAEFRPLMRINQEQFNGHTHSVNALYWNEELNLLVSAGDDRRLLAWKLEMD